MHISVQYSSALLSFSMLLLHLPNHLMRSEHERNDCYYPSAQRATDLVPISSFSRQLASQILGHGVNTFARHVCQWQHIRSRDDRHLPDLHHILMCIPVDNDVAASCCAISPIVTVL